ncbi:MAG: hypothetical protein N2654_05635 [Deltaproteobacteria bacterium]|nr:hypothetical protein [Deltaproteobacteria bacterium]
MVFCDPVGIADPSKLIQHIHIRKGEEGGLTPSSLLHQKDLNSVLEELCAVWASEKEFGRTVCFLEKLNSAYEQSQKAVSGEDGLIILAYEFERFRGEFNVELSRVWWLLDDLHRKLPEVKFLNDETGTAKKVTILRSLVTRTMETLEKMKELNLVSFELREITYLLKNLLSEGVVDRNSHSQSHETSCLCSHLFALYLFVGLIDLWLNYVSNLGSWLDTEIKKYSNPPPERQVIKHLDDSILNFLRNLRRLVGVFL